MAGSGKEPCTRLRRSCETSRQGHRRACHHTGRHLGGRNRSRKRGRLQSSVPGCSAAKGSEELGQTEPGGRHRSECDRRPPGTANGCCCPDLVIHFLGKKPCMIHSREPPPSKSLS